MKKFIISAIAVMMAAFSTNAQVWVGGSINYSQDKTVISFADNDNTTTAKVFSFNPEVGYNFNDKMAVGLAIQTSYPKNAVNFSVNPYFRYSFCQTGIASFFLDGGLYLANEKVKDTDFKFGESTFGASIKPGVAFAISQRVSLVAHAGEIGYYWKTVKGELATTKTSKFVAGVNNYNVGLSVYYTL